MPATADNKPEEDARHLCMLSSLHCVRLQSRRFATFVAGDRNDFFRRDVICHGRGRASDKVPRTTFLRGKNAKREDIKKRIDRVR